MASANSVLLSPQQTKRNAKDMDQNSELEAKYKRRTKNYLDYFYISSFMRDKETSGSFIKDHSFHIVDNLLGNFDISLIGFYKIVGKI